MYPAPVRGKGVNYGRVYLLQDKAEDPQVECYTFPSASAKTPVLSAFKIANLSIDKVVLSCGLGPA